MYSFLQLTFNNTVAVICNGIIKSHALKNFNPAFLISDKKLSLYREYFLTQLYIHFSETSVHSIFEQTYHTYTHILIQDIHRQTTFITFFFKKLNASIFFVLFHTYIKRPSADHINFMSPLRHGHVLLTLSWSSRSG